MKRKVNLVGENTLTISLPNKWTKKYNIKKGDELEVSDKGSLIFISKTIKKLSKKSFLINANDLNRFLLDRTLYTLYIEGAEIITVTFEKDEIHDTRATKNISLCYHVKETCNKLIGLEVISQSRNSIVMESLISKEETEKMETVRRRVGFLIKEFIDEFKNALNSNFKEFDKKSYQYHDNIVKFLYHYLRLLNSSEIDEDMKAALFNIHMIGDRIIDKIRHISNQIAKMKTVTTKIKEFVNELFEFLTHQLDSLNIRDLDWESLDEIVKKRYKLIDYLKNENFNVYELKVIVEARMILDTTSDFIDTVLVICMKELYEKNNQIN